jgi:hypothetical protein
MGHEFVQVSDGKNAVPTQETGLSGDSTVFCSPTSMLDPYTRNTHSPVWGSKGPPALSWGLG